MRITTKKFLIWIYKDFKSFFRSTFQLTSIETLNCLKEMTMLPVAFLIVRIEVLNGKTTSFKFYGWL